MKMFRSLRSAGLLLAVSTIALLGTTFTGEQAQAYSSSVSLKIVSSGCTTELAWNSRISKSSSLPVWPMYKAPQRKGTVKYCNTKLRAADSSKSKDYYIMDIKSEWSKKKDTKPESISYFYGGAPWDSSVVSNKASVGNEYSATKSFSKPGSETSISVGINLAAIGFSASQTFKGPEAVTRSALSLTSATWKGKEVDDLSTIELAFGQAVKAKQVPTYTMTLKRPDYTYRWKQVQQCVRGNCYMGWVPTQTGTSKSLTVTR